MESGSHSLTLERLYAWEKKLYEEVKVNLIHTLSYDFLPVSYCFVSLFYHLFAVFSFSAKKKRDMGHSLYHHHIDMGD